MMAWEAPPDCLVQRTSRQVQRRQPQAHMYMHHLRVELQALKPYHTAQRSRNIKNRPEKELKKEKEEKRNQVHNNDDSRKKNHSHYLDPFPSPSPV